MRAGTLHEAAANLKKGKVGVLPTDTLYGLVGLAKNQRAVRAIFRLKKRSPKKPLIVLISSLSDLNRFGIKVNQKGQRVLKKIWPGKISILLPCPQKRYQYLHRGTGYLAFRLPQKTWLRRLIKKTGPLVAPSANPEGLAPAQTAGEARKYFGQKISFYFSRGRLAGPPSTLAVLEPDGALKIIRPGAVKLNRKIKTTP